MTRCSWCGEEIHEECLYCNFDCMRNFEKYGFRKLIFDFAKEMETVIQEEIHKDKSLAQIVEELKEKRSVVNSELDYLPSEAIGEYLLNEAIMVMLVRQRITDYGKHAKLDAGGT